MKGQDRFQIGINWQKSMCFHGAESIYIKCFPGFLEQDFIVVIIILKATKSAKFTQFFSRNLGL